MTRLSDIESAIDRLPPEEQQQLLLFLAARLRDQAGELPTARKFSSEKMKPWIVGDEAEMSRIRNGKMA